MPVEIALAYDDFSQIRRLFLEYAAMLGVDLGFQGFDDELRGLPGEYACQGDGCIPRGAKDRRRGAPPCARGMGRAAQ